MSEEKEENVCASHDGLRSPIRRPNAKEALFIITLKFYHQTNIYKKNKTGKGRGRRRNERERERERVCIFTRLLYESVFLAISYLLSVVLKICL